MARTQAADYEQRREAILEKAASLFAKNGFRGTSVADLAQACDTSKSLIYHYYPSKEDVLYAVMLSHIDQLIKDVETVMARNSSPEDLLRALILAFMEHYVGAASRQKVLLNELASLPDKRRTSIVAKQRRIIEAVQGLMQKIDRKLARDPARAKVKAMLMFGMINWAHTWYDEKGRVKPSEIASMAADQVLRDLKA